MMRSRTIGLILFGGLLLVLLLSVAMFSSQQARADPPVNGDWIINNPQTFTDKNFIVNGSLLVKNNGRLTLINTSIRMNPIATGFVQVEKGGALLVRDRSQFMNTNGKSYAFVTFVQSTLEITNSSIYGAGWAWGTNGSTAGIYIDTNNVLIQDSTFSWDYYGIVDNGRDLSITGCIFTNITNSGLQVSKANVKVSDSQFMWDRTGIRVQGGTIDGNNLTIIANTYGLHSVNSFANLSASKVKDNYYDLYARNSTVVIINSTMWSEGYEFHIVNGTQLHLLNTTFNDQAIAYDDNTDVMDVWWFARVHVTWQNGNPIAGANLTVKDLTGFEVYNNSVPADGWSDVMILNEYVLITGTTGAQTFYTPHNMTGSYKGFTNTVFASFISSRDIELKVLDLKAPLLNLTFPKTNVATNHMPFKINGTASDEGSGLDMVLVSAGSADWVTANGTSKWNFTLNITYDGVYLIQAMAFDMVGNSFTAGFYLTLDTVPPFFDIYGPLNGTLTNATSVNVTGLIELGGKVTVNGLNTTYNNHTGFWYLVVPLKEGNNNILIVAKDKVGNQRQAILVVKRDTLPPNLQIGTPSDGFTTMDENISVTGSTEMDAKVTINGQPVYNGNGQLNTLYKLRPGLNQLRIRAQDAAGNFRELLVNVTYDNEAPLIAISAPEDHLVTSSNTIIVRGLTEPGATVIVGGFPATNTNGMFERNLTLKDGLNVIIIKSTDAAGNENTAIINVTFDNTAPALSIDAPANNVETTSANITISITVPDAKFLYVNGNLIDISKMKGPTYYVKVPLSLGANPITVRAEDAVGNHVDKSINVNRLAKKSTTNTKPLTQRLFDFNDPVGLLFLLALIIVIAGCVVAGVMAARAPPSQPSRPRGPPPEREGEGAPPYRGRGPPPRRGPPPPRRPGYEGAPPPRRPGYPTRPGGAYAGPAYSPEPEPPAPPVLPEPEPSPPVYAPQPEPMVEETPPPTPKVVEYEEPTPITEPTPEPGIPEIPTEEPPQSDHDQLEASIANILTTLETKSEEPSAPEVVPMSLPLEVRDETPKTKDALSEITCPNCHADVKNTWATCPFCDYNIKGGGKPTTKSEQPKDEGKKPKEPAPEPKEAPKEAPKEKAPLPTKASGGEVRPIDLEEPGGRPLKAPAPEPKVEPEKPPQPKQPEKPPQPKQPEKPPEPKKPEKPAKDGKNLDDILKKLKIS